MEDEYISLDEATDQLGVARGTMHYYLRTLKIKTHKFPLDIHAYLTLQEFQTIKELKEQAAKRSQRRAQGQKGTV